MEKKMKKLSIVTIGLALVMASTALARHKNVATGLKANCPQADIAGLWQNSDSYGKVNRENLGTFSISQPNCGIVDLVDLQNRIAYQLDIGGTYSVSLPERYLKRQLFSTIRGAMEKAVIKGQLDAKFGNDKSVFLSANSEIVVLDEKLPVNVVTEAILVSSKRDGRIDRIDVTVMDIQFGKINDTGIRGKILGAISALLNLARPAIHDTLYRLD